MLTCCTGVGPLLVEEIPWSQPVRHPTPGNTAPFSVDTRQSLRTCSVSCSCCWGRARRSLHSAVMGRTVNDVPGLPHHRPPLQSSPAAKEGCARWHRRALPHCRYGSDRMCSGWTVPPDVFRAHNSFYPTFFCTRSSCDTMGGRTLPQDLWHLFSEFTPICPMFLFRMPVPPATFPPISFWFISVTPAPFAVLSLAEIFLI